MRTAQTSLEKARRRKGLTLKQVGVLIGTDASNVLRYETGAQQPRPARARALARLLELTLEQVYAVAERRSNNAADGGRVARPAPAGDRTGNHAASPMVAAADPAGSPFPAQREQAANPATPAIPTVEGV